MTAADTLDFARESIYLLLELAAPAMLTALVVGVAYSRLYFNAHWLSDVLGGATGGGAYLGACLAYHEWRDARRAVGAVALLALAFLVVLAPLTAESRGVIGEKLFAAMKPSA